MSGKKVLKVIIYLLACLVLWGILSCGLLVTPLDNSFRWRLLDALQYVIPLIWVFGTLVIIGERK